MEQNPFSNLSKRTEKATLGGGCFWCTEAVFSELRGVLKAESGYAGGEVVNPTYQQVTTGTTGHAEVNQVTFDPSIITYREILEIFFTTHDPTTIDRQGNDIGPQYRSVIFYHSTSQKATAEAVKKEFEEESVYDDPIVTQIEPFTTFYIAEEYHRDYYTRNPELAYCRIIISPKVRKLRKIFRDKLKVVNG
jgi:peptide-methionine (S)-S-oxide reductase